MQKLIVISLVLLMAIPARADDWLHKLDNAVRAADNSHGTQTMVLIDADGSQKKRVIESWQDGDKSLARFREPVGVACVGFLVYSSEDMYIYMPAFGKIRRIASHIRNQSFMGSDFSYNDMSRKRMAEDHVATVSSEDDKTVTLKVVPKEGVEDDYDIRTVTMDKATALPKKILFRKDGKDVKKMTVFKTEAIDGVNVITSMQMENLETGHKTRMEMAYDAVNKGVSKKIFSKRKLQRCK